MSEGASALARAGTAARRLTWTAMLGLLVAPAIAAPPATDFDAVFDAAKARYHLPGLAIGVIEDGEVVYARADGELVAGSGQPVNRDTLFKIASNTKAMTVAVLARLVDAGKLRWDDPVTRYLPQFRMYEPWVTREMQVRDLLIHNSGLPEGAGDLMLWPEPNHFDRADIIAGLAHLKPERSFRSGYAYDNLLYVVAGEVAAAAGGASYEELVRRGVFEPLGLDRCRVGEFDRREVGNVAQPHWYVDGRNVVVGADPQVVPKITSAAAGGIRCSLGDMLTWAKNWLVPTPAQLEWLSPVQRRAIWTAHTPMPISQQRREWDDTHLYAYGYGFRLADIDGEWSVSHTGTLSGMYSLMHLLPDRESGFVVMMNGSSSAARTVLNRVLLDHFLKPERDRGVDWYADALEAGQEATADAAGAPDTSARQPAQAGVLGDRLGIYRDPWFGEISLCGRDDAVQFASVMSPELSGQLMRVGDRYLVDWTADSVDVEAWLDFHDAAGQGQPDITMAKTDPEADFSYDYEDLAFTRVGDCPTSTAPELSPATTPAEANLVDIRELVPDIALDIRYATADNFVGTPVDGYDAPKCYLLRPVAEALREVERDLRRQHLRLKLFDCYRPARAVAHFVRWAGDLDDTRTKADYYPNLDKSDLLGDYIAPISGHSRGATLDLTLLQCDADGENCRTLDMGTPFDYFDERAHTDSPQVTKAQRTNRHRLRAAMARHGFENYPLEWWHYTYQPEPTPNLLYDVPIR